MTIRNDGSGGCTWARTTGWTGNPLGPFQSCTNLFPGRACASYQGALRLILSYRGALPFIEPDFQANLNTVGLGNVTGLWWLHVYLAHMTPIPRDIKLTFLPGLTLIRDQLAAYECVADPGCHGPPAQSRLVGLSATSNVYRIRDVSIGNTALPDLTFVRGLQCAPEFMILRENVNLVPLRGSDGIEPRYTFPPPPQSVLLT